MTPRCEHCGEHLVPDKPAELSEEERAALKAHNDGVRESGLSESFWTVDYFAADKERRAYLVAFWLAARAPLEAELTKLRQELDVMRRIATENIEPAQVRRMLRKCSKAEYKQLRARIAELEERTTGRLGGVIIRRLEARVREREAQLAQAQKPAAPAGLPEVGKPVIVYSREFRYEADVVSHDDCHWFSVKIRDGKSDRNGEVWKRDIRDEGLSWLRLPPVQSVLSSINRHDERLTRIQAMSDEAIATELADLEGRFKKSRKDDEEGAAGSPGEWMVERMGELETEQKRREALPVPAASPPAQTSRETVAGEDGVRGAMRTKLMNRLGNPSWRAR